MTIYIRRLVGTCAVIVAVCGAPNQAEAQSRDSLLNGAIIGAGIGVGMNYALRDSDLTIGQYTYGAVVCGAIGAGIGLGVDALFSRSSPRTTGSQRRLLFAPGVGRVNGLTLKWQW